MNRKKLLNILGFKVGVFTDKKLLPDNKNDLEIYESWDEVFESSNAIELLRVQKERLQDNEEINFDEYINNYQLTQEILGKSKVIWLFFIQCQSILVLRFLKMLLKIGK